VPKRPARLLTLLSCFFAVGQWAYGADVKAPAPASVAAAIDLTTIPVTLYLNADGKCKALFSPQGDIISGGFVAWRIDNQCSKAQTVKLEKFKKGGADVKPPFNKGCHVTQSPDKDEVEWVICKVKKDLVAGDEYTYSIAGDFDADPKLVVRPPSLLCEFCRELMAREHCEAGSK
jgi:hypothetical protein